MAGRRRPRSHGNNLAALVTELPSLVVLVEGMVTELRTTVAVWSRSLADRLVGPVERWCPICELELQLHASDRSCLAQNGDDDA